MSQDSVTEVRVTNRSGLLASIFSGVLFGLGDIELIFALELRDTLLILFFTCIGLSSKFSSLLQGGKSLLILLVIAIIYLFLQNITGLSVIAVTNLPPEAGLIGGSVSLSGGHGTAIAWAPRFIADYGVSNAMEIGIACATFGLILGGLIGGPIAKYLIIRHDLKPSNDPELTVGISHEVKESPIDYRNMLDNILILSVSIGLGISLDSGLSLLGLNLPDFVSCLFAGILITNFVPMIFPKTYWPDKSKSLALISDLSLGLFLAMSLMSLQLWTLTEVGGGIVLLLMAQLVVITLFSIFVVFRLLGQDYDAAVISSGYAGLALGATPTAIANMTAVTEKYGASAKAFIVVPLVGAFFIDLANTFIIQFFLDQF